MLSVYMLSVAFNHYRVCHYAEHHKTEWWGALLLNPVAEHPV
jgi:hypothetical protein